MYTYNEKTDKFEYALGDTCYRCNTPFRGDEYEMAKFGYLARPVCFPCAEALEKE